MRIQSISRLAAVALLTLLSAVAPAVAKTIRLVALGDSLTAGYGLAKADSFTAKLEALHSKASGETGAAFTGGVRRKLLFGGPMARGKRFAC